MTDAPHDLAARHDGLRPLGVTGGGPARSGRGSAGLRRSNTRLAPALGDTARALFDALVVAALSLTALACSRSDCDGTEIERNGKCETLCVDSECEQGERCVENQCSPECERDAECPNDGECRSVNADYGGRGKFCIFERPQTDGGPQPPARTDCTSSDECSAQNSQRCIDGRCVVTCLLHDHCGSIGSCTGEATDAEGNDVAFCEADGFERGPGQYGWSCVDGNDDCDDEADFHCLTAGEGDLDAYCVKFGCDDDVDCPAGYFCNADTFASLRPCETACGLPADPTNPNCIPAEDIGNGAAFRCVDQGLQLRSCRRREYCNECETDADCRGKPNQVCARDESGSKVCTVLCDPLANSCPWGAASTCAVHDTRLGQATCGHRSGSCRGTGASCDPCTDDADCPYGFCTASSFTGERFCLDLRDSCSCADGTDSCVGGGCPTTASGLEMNCVPLTSNGPPEACYAGAPASGDDGSNISCWPAQR